MANAKETGEKVDDMYHQVKDSANKAYEEGRKKVIQAEQSLEHFSEELLKEVRENPLRSVLIAGGVGYILATLLRKK